jgi:hypothetical protein
MPSHRVPLRGVRDCLLEGGNTYWKMLRRG